MNPSLIADQVPGLSRSSSRSQVHLDIPDSAVGGVRHCLILLPGSRLYREATFVYL